MIIEGVRYYRFRVTFRLTTGQRRRWIRWSPGWPWLGSEISRELQNRFTLAELPVDTAIRIEHA